MFGIQKLATIWAKIKVDRKERRFQEALSEMKGLLDKNKQSFFLVCGTALGVHRENRFTPHMEDIDVGMMYSDFNLAIIDKITQSKKFKLCHVFGELEKGREFSFLHRNGTKIDIHLYYKISNEYYYHATFTGICEEKDDGFCKFGFHIRGFTEVEFYEEKYNIPANIEEYLSDTYGPDYMTPIEFDYHEGLDWGFKNLLN